MLQYGINDYKPTSTYIHRNHYSDEATLSLEVAIT